MNIDQVLFSIFVASLLVIVCAKIIARSFLKYYEMNKIEAARRVREKKYFHKFPDLEIKQMIWIVRLSGAMGVAGIVFMYFFVKFVDNS